MLEEEVKRLYFIEKDILSISLYFYWIFLNCSKLWLTIFENFQDKFGRGRVHILASNVPNVRSIRVQQRFARDVVRAESSCARASCTHLCVELPGNGFSCLCPDLSTSLNVSLIECETYSGKKIPLLRYIICDQLQSMRIYKR